MGSATNLEDIAVGYNNEDCLKIDSGIEEVYSASITSIQNHFKSDLVDKVATEWYSEVAVSYFAKWQGLCANTSDDLHMVFQNFRDQVQENINNWRTQTGSSGIDLQNIIMKTISIDISSINTVDDSGNRYISNNIEDSLSGWINTCRANIISDISTKVAEKTVGGFIGESQNDAINNAMSGLAVIIDNILRFLDTGENSLYNAISDYRKKYTQTGNDVANNSLERDYGEGIDQNNSSDSQGGGSPSSTTGGSGGSGSSGSGSSPNPGGNGNSNSNPYAANASGAAGSGNGNGNGNGNGSPSGSGTNPDDIDWAALDQRPSYMKDQKPNAPSQKDVPPKTTSDTNGSSSGSGNGNGNGNGNGSPSGSGTNPDDIDWAALDQRPSYMKDQRPDVQASSRPVTIEELEEKWHKEYVESNDFSRMLNRMGQQVFLAPVGLMEKAFDCAGTVANTFIGSEELAGWVADDLTGGIQGEYDRIYANDDGTKYNSKAGQFIGPKAEALTRAATETAITMGALKGLSGLSSTTKGFKYIKAGFAGIMEVGESGQSNYQSALDNGTDIRLASATSIVGGAGKATTSALFDGWSDANSGNIRNRAIINGLSGTTKEIIEMGEGAIVGADPKTPGEVATGIGRKTGESVVFDTVEKTIETQVKENSNIEAGFNFLKETISNY